MWSNFALALPLADILVFGVIIFFAFRGFMRGALRELFSFLRIYFSFIVAAVLYKKSKSLLQHMFDMPSWLAEMITFIAIFVILLFILWLIGAIVGKRISKPESKSKLSKIGGIVLGLAEGVLVVSVIIMVVNFHSSSHEVQSPLEDAVSYKAVEPIAPSIRDFTTRSFSFLKKTSSKPEPDRS